MRKKEAWRRGMEGKGGSIPMLLLGQDGIKIRCFWTELVSGIMWDGLADFLKALEKRGNRKLEVYSPQGVTPKRQ